MSEKTKIVMHKRVFRSILSFGSKICVLTNAMKSTIQAVDIKFLKRIKGITRMDKITNDMMREELGQGSELHVTDKLRMKQFGHLGKMTD